MRNAIISASSVHRDGEGGPVDLAEARRLFGLAAAHGHAGAQAVLGHMHRVGQGGPVDLAEASRLLGLAAAQGHAAAQAMLGDMQLLGIAAAQVDAEAE